MEPGASRGRPTCYRCFRPQPMCLCAVVKPVANRCRVTVLQHPNERLHPFGTARFVRLGLENASTSIMAQCGRAVEDCDSLRAFLRVGRHAIEGS